MRLPRITLFICFVFVTNFLFGQEAPEGVQPWEKFMRHYARLVESVDQRPVRILVEESKGLGKELRDINFAFMIGEAGDFWVDIAWKDQQFELGRQGNELWVYNRGKSFGLWGKNGIPPFKADPDYLETVSLSEQLALPIPISRAQIQALPVMFSITVEPGEGERYAVRSNDMTKKLFGLKGLNMVWRFPEGGTFPCFVEVNHDGKYLKLKIDAEEPIALTEKLSLPEKRREEFTEVALSHLTKFFRVAYNMLQQRGKPWAPPGEVDRTHGKGRLVAQNGILVLYLEGTPQEIGEQHGVLLKKHIREVMDRMLYGVGVGSSFLRGRWFFGDIEEAQARLLPYMNPAYLEEMDALATAGGFHREEVRLTNFFPELFHCSGFAVYGKATEDGMLYHGRILDYMMGVGLERNAVVMVINPQDGHRWVNVGYAGFTGTVTAMNEKGVVIGEMGGDGWGDWDGKPMAQLMREVMERASSVEEGVAIFEEGPRTCEYYYVLSQANPNKAVGLYATPQELRIFYPGVAYERLERPVQDAVLMSARARYQKLADRVEENYGKIDAEEAWELMARPVAMSSNIQTALFRPETLDFWVAYASHDAVASARQPAEFNLKNLLEEFQQK